MGTGAGQGVLHVVDKTKFNTSYIDKNRVETYLRTKFPTKGVMFTKIKGDS